ncbi:MAG: glycoside hydrolase family 10 protein [Microcystis sp.]|uniref:glycoside hydrolase family 10 protein n=1 Tax=Microcystis sp. TaxID=1127 RepID=UPI00391C8A51
MVKFSKYLKRLGIVAGVAFLLLVTHRAAPRKAVENEQMKGVWLTNIGTILLHHTTSLDEVLNHLSRSGYDRVYFSVYGLRGTLYPTSQRPTNWLFVPPLSNPWRAAVKESLRQGLKPFAWFEYGLMLSPKDPIAKKHPDWLLKTPAGKTVVETNVWLDPANPQVQAYLLGNMEDILKEKDLAGIQLDDHWAVPRVFGNKSQALTNLTRKLHDHVKAINPKLVVSLSPNPHSFAVNKYNQNWLAWVRQGIVDEVVLQIYRKTPNQVAASLSGSGLATASRYVPVGVGLYAGWNPDFSLKGLQAQVRTVEQQGYGYSLFCWEFVVMRYLFNHIPRF